MNVNELILDVIANDEELKAVVSEMNTIPVMRLFIRNGLKKSNSERIVDFLEELAEWDRIVSVIKNNFNRYKVSEGDHHTSFTDILKDQTWTFPKRDLRCSTFSIEGFLAWHEDNAINTKVHNVQFVPGYSYIEVLWDEVKQ